MTEQRSILAISMTASFITPFMSSAVTVALPLIEREYSMSTMELGWISSTYLLTAAVLLIPFGRLADMQGRRKIFLIGAIVHFMASGLTIIAPTSAVLFALRALQGAGSAMVFSTTMAMLVAAYPPERRGRVLGISVSSTYTGLSLGPFVGGLLTQYAGWRSIFVVAALLGVFMTVLVVRNVPREQRGRREEKYDLEGAVLSALSLSALMCGLSMLPGTAGAYLIAAGAIGLIWFVFRESRCPYPMLNISLFKGNPVFVYSNLAALINYCATFAVTFLLSLYLQYIRGFTPQWAGTILIAQPVLMTAVSYMAGRLSDSIEPQILSSLGMAVIVAGLACCAFITSATPISAIIVFLAMLGIGFGLFSSPNTNAVMSSVERKHYSVASSVLGTMRLCGQMMSMGIVILIFASNIGKTRITPELHQTFISGMKIAFIVFASFSVIGVMASLARGKVRRSDT
jgi:MFS family permease